MRSQIQCVCGRVVKERGAKVRERLYYYYLRLPARYPLVTERFSAPTQPQTPSHYELWDCGVRWVGTVGDERKAGPGVIIRNVGVDRVVRRLLPAASRRLKQSQGSISCRIAYLAHISGSQRAWRPLHVNVRTLQDPWRPVRAARTTSPLSCRRADRDNTLSSNRIQRKLLRS